MVKERKERERGVLKDAEILEPAFPYKHVTLKEGLRKKKIAC